MFSFIDNGIEAFTCMCLWRRRSIAQRKSATDSISQAQYSSQFLQPTVSKANFGGLIKWDISQTRQFISNAHPTRNGIARGGHSNNTSVNLTFLLCSKQYRRGVLEYFSTSTSLSPTASNTKFVSHTYSSYSSSSSDILGATNTSPHKFRFTEQLGCQAISSDTSAPWTN